MEPITQAPRISTSFRVNSPHVQYTPEHILSEYQYRSTRTKFENGELVVEPVEQTYTFKTERQVPKLGYVQGKQKEIEKGVKEKLGGGRGRERKRNRSSKSDHQIFTSPLSLHISFPSMLISFFSVL
jgi:hypothetical protein